MEFVRGKSDEVVRGRTHNWRLLGRSGLDKDSASLGTAACAAGHLGDQLKRAFHRANIGLVQQRISVDHANQCDIRKIEPLRDHLGSEQNLYLTMAKQLLYDVCSVILVADSAETRDYCVLGGKAAIF